MFFPACYKACSKFTAVLSVNTFKFWPHILKQLSFAKTGMLIWFSQWLQSSSALGWDTPPETDLNLRSSLKYVFYSHLCLFSDSGHSRNLPRIMLWSLKQFNVRLAPLHVCPIPSHSRYRDAIPCFLCIMQSDDLCVVTCCSYCGLRADSSE